MPYLYPEDQKQPNYKSKNTDTVSIDKTPRLKLHPLEFPTSDGDLGILNIKSNDIPRQTRAPSRTTNGTTNSVSDTAKMTKIMKYKGMLV